MALGCIDVRLDFREGDVEGNLSCPKELMLSSSILCSFSKDTALESEL